MIFPKPTKFVCTYGPGLINECLTPATAAKLITYSGLYFLKTDSNFLLLQMSNLLKKKFLCFFRI